MENDMTGFNAAGSAKNKFRAETFRALFAEIIQAVSYEELPREVVIQSKKCLLDFIGVTLADGDLGLSHRSLCYYKRLETSRVGEFEYGNCGCINYRWRYYRFKHCL